MKDHVFAKKSRRHEARRAPRLRLAAALLALMLAASSGAAYATRSDAPSPTASETASAAMPGGVALREAYIRAARRIAAAKAASERLEKRRSAAAEREAVEATDGDPSPTAIAAPQAVAVIAPAGRFMGETRFEDGVTLVDAAAFARFAGAAQVTATGAAIRASGGGFDVTLTAGAQFVESSGRCFWTRRTLTFEDGRMFVPLSPLAAAFGFCAEADGNGGIRLTAIAAPQAVAVIAPTGRFTGETRFEDGVTLVDAAAFARFAGAAQVTATGAAIRASGGGFDVTLTAGAQFVESSGRCFWTRRTLAFEDGRMFVPLSPLAAAFGFCAEADGDGAVRLTGGGEIAPAQAYYDADALYWLARIINAESGGEPFAGKVAVGNVVLNRVRSPQYPDSVYGVVFDFRYGVQFTPAATGTVYNEPSAESTAAAKVCLEGYTLSEEIAFFFNPATAESSWIANNRPWVMTIGGHAFYA